MGEIKVVHYLNQFFAGVGGEEKTDTPVAVREGALGPGKGLEAMLGHGARIVATMFCGDNYFNDHPENAKQQILDAVRARAPQIFIAGPAFDNGRYGFACAEVCNLVAKEMDIFCVTAMYEENPGVDFYRQYKNSKVFLVPTSQSVASMKEALAAICHLAAKIVEGETIGSAAREGYLPRGIRLLRQVEKTGVERAVALLLAKVAGKPYSTEVPLRNLEPVTPARSIADLSSKTLALVTTSGLAPYGNPDGFKRYRNTEWKKYSIDGLSSLEKGHWEAIHGGYDTRFMNDNPNCGVPLDALRELEKEKVFGRLYPYLYSIPGVQASIGVMQRTGTEMAKDMKENGVEAVILTAT